MTFLDYSEAEARGADAVTKLHEKDKQIEALTKRQVLIIQSLIDSGQLKPNTEEIQNKVLNAVRFTEEK